MASTNKQSIKQTVRDFNKKRTRDKVKVGADSLDWLEKVNDFLEVLPETTNQFFSTTFKAGEEVTQKAVDMVCEYAAWRVNVMIERMRQKVITALYEQYDSVFSILAPIKGVKSAITNPLGAAINMANIFLGPFALVIGFVVKLTQQLIRLASNLASIGESLPPSPPNPNINFNAFKVKVGSISMGEVMAGPSGFQDPETMFPEPLNPFAANKGGTKAFFKALGDESGRIYKEAKPFYKANLKYKDLFDEKTGQLLSGTSNSSDIA